MQNAAVSEYELSLPISVTSVPWQCGDDVRHLRAGCVRQDLSRQIGGGGMRDRVVGVDDVELVLAADLDDLVGQRQQILRLPEQAVSRCLNGVEDEPDAKVRHPERHLRADQPDLVAAVGQRLGELGRHDAASTNRCVADDADVHAKGSGGLTPASLLAAGFRLRASGF